MQSIFNQSQPDRFATAQVSAQEVDVSDIPQELLRVTQPLLPEVSEMQTVRHYTCLSQQNYSIDTQFYPLGSCTMKYNPRGVQHMAHLPAFLNRHPLSEAEQSQGFLACLYELQDYLKEITGMVAVSLTQMAGSQGEFAGVSMIRAYHQARGEHQRCESVVIRDSYRAENQIVHITRPGVPHQRDHDCSLGLHPQPHQKRGHHRRWYAETTGPLQK